MPFPVRSALFGEQSGRRSGDNRLKLAIRTEFGLRFDPGNGGWGSSYILESGSWAPEAWHHLVITWDSNRGTEIYVDGKYIGCHGGEEFRSMLPINWKPLFSEGFTVGNDWQILFNRKRCVLSSLKIASHLIVSFSVIIIFCSFLCLFVEILIGCYYHAIGDFFIVL